LNAESDIKNIMHFRDRVRTRPTPLVYLRHCEYLENGSRYG